MADVNVALEYAYMPVYGTEPYVDNNGAGGAQITKQNLIVTAWSANEKAIAPPAYIDFEYILKPATVNTTLSAQDRVAGGKQAFNSRDAGYVYLNADISGESASPVVAVCFVLAPPPEMKQLLTSALEYNGGDPADQASYIVKKSLQASYLWKTMSSPSPGIHNAITSDIADAVFSSLFFFEDTPDLAGRLPFLKTSGVDGVAPEFFDVSTVQGTRDMIEAVNDQDYYVAFLMPLINDVTYLGMRYPHSIARV